MTTLGVGLFSYFNQSHGYNKSVAFTCVIVLPVIAIATWLFERYIDKPSIALANSVSDILLNNRKIQLNAKMARFAVITRKSQPAEAEE